MTRIKSILTAAAVVFALPAMAGDAIVVSDAYARVSGPGAASGAAFMMIENHSDAEDRLIDVRSDIAERVELHTHKEDANGVMQMLHVDEGFAVPAAGKHMLQRGGDHVMFMGLKQSLDHGDVISVTLVFEKSGEMTVEIPVDLKRMPANMGTMQPAAPASN